MCTEIPILLVLCVLCLAGIAHSISNGDDRQHTQTQGPNRRFYFYNTELIPHAAAALGMVVPQAFYHAPQYPQYSHFSEEEEEVEEHEDKVPPPMQLVTYVRPKQQQQKKKKVKKKNRHKTVKKVRKTPKRCMPFRVRIIKKADLNSDSPFYTNIRSQLPYGYGDEYFPQNSKSQELALISFNTSSLSSRFPGTLNFVYPRYTLPPRSRVNPSQHKNYRFAKPPRKRFTRPYIMKPGRTWSQINPWRLASPGKPVLEFPLKEPIPGALGGSPPPSPLVNFYKDNRIPLNYGEEHNDNEQVAQNYANVESSTSSYVTDYYYQGQHWDTPETPTSETPSTSSSVDYEKNYSEHDYYRYGTYTQNQFQNNQHLAQTREPPSFQNYVSSPEKIVTVTPTSFWVPVPQTHQVSRPINENASQSSAKFSTQIRGKVHYMSGFKNLSSLLENATESYNFGDKILTKKNCTTYFGNTIENSDGSNNCQPETIRYAQNGGKLKSQYQRRVANREYYSKQELKDNVGTTIDKYDLKSLHGRKVTSIRVEAGDVPKENRKTGRSYEENLKIQRTENSNQTIEAGTEIVTSRYPQDNLNGIYISLTNSSSTRARRSDKNGFSAVVSSSMIVQED